MAPLHQYPGLRPVLKAQSMMLYVPSGISELKLELIAVAP
ncbi:hypothetical protein J2W68_001351 [Luteimonas terrae]|uniref:RidA family protein n=1 Tax=Luteimonas terrae TaxID=1530191 RepID=A0ABU1XV55_9GAMM|nr:hypothetical protein [Luteimonas terrae]